MVDAAHAEEVWAVFRYKFHNFAKLPPEIRHMIWDLSMSRDRVLTYGYYPTPHRDDTPLSESSNSADSAGTSEPSDSGGIWRCFQSDDTNYEPAYAEARRQASKFYALDTVENKTLIDHEQDVFYFTKTIYEVWTYCKFWDLSLMPLNLSEIHHVAVDWHDIDEAAHCDGEVYMFRDFLELFPQLERLFIVLSVDQAPRADAVDLTRIPETFYFRDAGEHDFLKIRGVKRPVRGTKKCRRQVTKSLKEILNSDDWDGPRIDEWEVSRVPIVVAVSSAETEPENVEKQNIIESDSNSRRVL